MYGPKPSGFWSQHSNIPAGTPYRHLVPARRYEVIRPWTDFDGHTHAIGEAWIFVAWSYLPHDNGLSLFVSLDSQQEWAVQMQCRPEEQGAIVDSLEEYLREVVTAS